jgi:hypothetical protein
MNNARGQIYPHTVASQRHNIETGGYSACGLQLLASFQGEVNGKSAAGAKL